MAPDEADWLVLLDARRARVVAIQQVDELTPTDLARARRPDAAAPRLRGATAARSSSTTASGPRRSGARVLLDRTDDEDEALYVLADLAGHPFCLLVR